MWALPIILYAIRYSNYFVYVRDEFPFPFPEDVVTFNGKIYNACSGRYVLVEACLVSGMVASMVLLLVENG